MAIPNSVTSIGEQVLYGVDTFRDLTVGGGIREIPMLTFANLINLQTVVIRDGVTLIGKEAFKGCSKLMEITLSSTLIKIEDDAFHNCMQLQSINMPASLKYIGANAFMNCNNLNIVNFEVVSNWYVGTDIHFNELSATVSDVLSSGLPHVLLKETHVNKYWKNID